VAKLAEPEETEEEQQPSLPVSPAPKGGAKKTETAFLPDEED
jgi:hypothetical protein